MQGGWLLCSPALLDLLCLHGKEIHHTLSRFFNLAAAESEGAGLDRVQGYPAHFGGTR
jgi:hypothetical protein